MKVNELINTNYILPKHIKVLKDYLEANPNEIMDMANVKITSRLVKTELRKVARVYTLIDTSDNYNDLVYKSIKIIHNGETRVESTALDDVHNCPRGEDLKSILEIIKMISESDVELVLKPSRNSKLDVLYVAACYLTSEKLAFDFNIVVAKALKAVYTVWKEQFNLKDADMFDNYFLINQRLQLPLVDGKFTLQYGELQPLSEIEAIPYTHKALVGESEVFKLVLRVIFKQFQAEYDLEQIRLSVKKEPNTYKDLLEAEN